MRFMTSFSFVVATSFAVLGTQASTNNSIAELGATIVINDEGGCEDLCTNVTSCNTDPHAHGSYCKFWQDPPVCFGMYQNTSFTNTSDDANTTSLLSQVCFQPNDAGCNDLVLPPVTCPNQVNTTCARVCQETPDCLNDPQHGGSFCKLDMNVCFGLYWTSSNHTEACYAPNGSNSTCPTTDPVTCNGGVPLVTTTISPASTAAGETTTTAATTTTGTGVTTTASGATTTGATTTGTSASTSVPVTTTATTTTTAT